MEQTALNVDTSNLLIAMPVLAAAGGLGGFFPPLVMGVTYEGAANNYFKRVFGFYGGKGLINHPSPNS